MNAHGQPGIAPTWSSSAKDSVSTALGPSRLWATLGYGIINEVFYPSTGEPQIRDLGFIVARGDSWFEIKRVNQYTLSLPEPYIPLPLIVHEGNGYRLTLEVVCDPQRETLLICYALSGEGFKLYPLLAPHLGPKSNENTAWTEADALCATGGSDYLCLMTDGTFERSSAGYVGASDGWHDFHENGKMTWTYDQAEKGNVALMAELAKSKGTLALGFANSKEGARTRASSSLAEGFKPIRERFIGGWKDWGKGLTLPGNKAEVKREAYLSAMVLKVHEDKSFPGAVVASLSIPWGSSHDDIGGYHLVWARDAVEAGLGLLAAGQTEDARRMLAYLIATQQKDGHWSQNMFPDGKPYWTGIQLDEVGFPVLLAAKLKELNALGEVQGVEDMAARAIAYLAQHGPISPQDRWEENAGASPFTLAVSVAALVAGSSFLNKDDKAYALSLADYWNERIENWTYSNKGGWDEKAGVEGYYVRIAPNLSDGGLVGRIDVRNRNNESLDVTALISMDFMYLSRLGLRAASDPKMQNTLKVAEMLLKVDTPSGVSFHRYNQDGYGEHEDGSPFNGTGIGRAWPLLTGERGHFALQEGEDPQAYLSAMIKMTGPGGLIPEQIWDSEAIPEHYLYPGKPSGSAMPLVWAHAEFLKLLYAMKQGEPLELLDSVKKRYKFQVPRAKTWHWRSDTPFSSLPTGRNLIIEASQTFSLEYQLGDTDPQEKTAQKLGLGIYGLRFKRTELSNHKMLNFSLRFQTDESKNGRIQLK